MEELKMENKKIFVMILVLAIVVPVANAVLIDEISYSIKMQFDGDNTWPINAKLVEGKAAREDQTETYKYQLQLASFKGEKLISKGFNLPNYWFDIDVVIENGTFIMFLPYHTNAQKIEVYRESRKISEFDVSNFASCNQDSFCSLNENLKECPEDCTVKDAELTEFETPKGEILEEKPAALIEQQKIRLSILIGSILLMILIVAVYFATKKTRGKK